MRMKLLEGKKITGSGGSVADNSPKFSAPVAKEAPQSIVGGSISNDELKPIRKPTAAEVYQKGLEALKASDFAAAEENFNTVLNKYPKDNWPAMPNTGWRNLLCAGRLRPGGGGFCQRLSGI